jgi:hypothetical protein
MWGRFPTCAAVCYRRQSITARQWADYKSAAAYKAAPQGPLQQTTEGDRLPYFCKKKLPTNMASMPEE